jgi:hypothetical protein
MVRVNISGFNFGQSTSDINFVSIRGTPCTSLVRISSTELTCLSSKAGVVDSLGPDDVHLSMIGGEAKGIYLQALAAQRSRSGRPVIAAITFETLPFVPYALAVLLDEKGGRTIYFSNIGIDAYSIHRCQIDGSHIETVFKGVQKVLGLAVIPIVQASYGLGGSLNNTNVDIILYTDSETNTLNRLLVDRLNNGTIYSPSLAHLPVTTQVAVPGNYLVDLLGTPAQILSNLQAPTGIAVDILSR